MEAYGPRRCTSGSRCLATSVVAVLAGISDLAERIPLMTVATDTVASEWVAKAQALADWTLARMVNRTDQWAQYLPVEQRSYSRIVRIAPAKQMRGRVCLTADLLSRHYGGANLGHLIGLHAKGADGSARWVCVDLGEQDPSAPATPAANLKAALAWHDTLKEQGFQPILEDSSGRGDYHLWVIFGDKVDSGTAWMFARTLVGNYADLSLPAPPKVYPRRAQVEAAAFKDWVRLPGRHHSHNHWSRIWNGACWLEGIAAADAILNTRIAPGHFALPAVNRPDKPLSPAAEDETASLEEQMAEVFEIPPAAPAAAPAPSAVPVVSGPPTSDQPGNQDGDDLRTIADAWPELPPVVKAGILAMVRSAQSHR